MLCKRCMVVMKTGKKYEQKKGQEKPRHIRYLAWNKCHDRVYTNGPNFQEMLTRLVGKSRNITSLIKIVIITLLNCCVYQDFQRNRCDL